jgi:polysaccharide export outer membrane protein
MKRNPLIASICVLALNLALFAQAPKQDTKTSQPAPAAKNDAASASNATDRAYVIGTEDVVIVNVWHEPEMSRALTVRPDGKISIPLAGEFQAAGETAADLEGAITKKLTSLIQNPQVTVIVQEIKSKRFNIMGEVNRPGTYPLQPEMTIIDAVALAGGLRDFAKPKKMYVLRGNSKIPVNYKEVIGGKLEANLKLESKDTVVVP